MRRFVMLVCSIAAATLLCFGCTQSDGDPCQENDDCSSGICCKTGGAAVERGTCSSTACMVIARDAGPGTDAGVRDSGVRLDAAVDAAAAVDAGVAIDAGGADAGAADAGAAIDAGGAVDAGSDAGAAPVDAGADAGRDAG